MPTFGKLVGAVWFGVLAWYVSGMIIPLLPEGIQAGWFREVNLLIGLYVGWSLVGPRAGDGYINSISHGLTALVVLVVLGLFINSFLQMIQVSFRDRLDGLGAAFEYVFEMFAKNGLMIAKPDIALTLLAGGVGGGLVTEVLGRRFS